IHMILFIIFFFQAEDGIRAFHVTGVQTCALPIYSRSRRYSYIPTAAVLAELRREGFQPFMVCQTRVRQEGRREHTKHMLRLRHRSEERRVGKEGSCLKSSVK